MFWLRIEELSFINRKTLRSYWLEYKAGMEITVRQFVRYWYMGCL